MPHGDFSDIAAIAFLAMGGITLYNPLFHFQKFAPLEASFDGRATPELVAVVRLLGGLAIGWGILLSINRWNTLNGKAGGVLCQIGAGTLIYNTLTLDKYVFKARPAYIIAALFVLTSLHLIFNANKLHTWQALKAEEDKKAAAKTE